MTNVHRLFDCPAPVDGAYCNCPVESLTPTDIRAELRRICNDARQKGLRIHGFILEAEDEAKFKTRRAQADGVVRFTTCNGVCSVYPQPEPQ